MSAIEMVRTALPGGNLFKALIPPLSRAAYGDTDKQGRLPLRKGARNPFAYIIKVVRAL